MDDALDMKGFAIWEIGLRESVLLSGNYFIEQFLVIDKRGVPLVHNVAGLREEPRGAQNDEDFR